MITAVQERTPGLREARNVERRIKSHGITDIKLFFDNSFNPGIWQMVQVRKDTKRVILPTDYMTDGIEPYTMYLLKDESGSPRLPDGRDVENARMIVYRAHQIWREGEDYMEKRMQAIDDKRNEDHHRKQRERIAAAAPALKRALQRDQLRGRVS